MNTGIILQRGKIMTRLPKDKLLTLPSPLLVTVTVLTMPFLQLLILPGSVLTPSSFLPVTVLVDFLHFFIQQIVIKPIRWARS